MRRSQLPPGSAPDVATVRRILDRLDVQVARLRAGLPRGDSRLATVLRAVAERDEEELAKLGVDARHAWLDDIAAALLAGSGNVEIEVARLCAAHHLDETGRLAVCVDNLSDDETAGVLLAAILRDAFDGNVQVRLTVTLDDVYDDVGGHDFTEDERDRFARQIDRITSEHVVLVRQSESRHEVDQLVERLGESGRGTMELTGDGDVTFWPTPTAIAQLTWCSADRRREFARRGIAIRRYDRPTSHAIDAAGLLTMLDRSGMRLATLDRRFAARQDKIYALLRALDLTRQDNHHGIHYDTQRLTPPVVALAICELLIGAFRHLLALEGRFDAWESFGAKEYRERVYGRGILPEDREVIYFVVERLSAILPEQVDSVIDVGAGPNLYPAMLVAPHVADEGSITLLDPVAANLDALRTSLHGLAAGSPEPTWTNFEDLMTRRDQRYAGTCRRLPGVCRVRQGSLHELPAAAYDIVTSFYVAESITTSRREFRLAIRSLGHAVRPGGVLVLAFVIGSVGYHAGEGTRFPAVRLHPEDVEDACRDADLEYTLHVVRHGRDDRTARAGYEGVAAVVARRVR